MLKEESELKNMIDQFEDPIARKHFEDYWLWRDQENVNRNFINMREKTELRCGIPDLRKYFIEIPTFPKFGKKFSKPVIELKFPDQPPEETIQLTNNDN